MAGENFFKFNKDKQMDYSTFKMKIDMNSVADENARKLFNIFDTHKEDGTLGKDGILSGNEIKNLWERVKIYAEDDILDDEETASFLDASFDTEIGSLKQNGFNANTLINALNIIQDKIVPQTNVAEQQNKIKPQTDILDLRFTNDGKCIYTVKQGNYLVDVIRELGSDDSEEIFYDTNNLEEIKNGTANKVYRINVKNGKEQHYFIAPDGKEYTPEQIKTEEDRIKAEEIKNASKSSLDVVVDTKKLPLPDADKRIPFMLSGDSQGLYIREGDKIYAKDDKGERYLTAQIMHGTHRKMIIYADKEQTQGWEYYINDPEHPKFDNFFVSDKSAYSIEKTGYGDDHKKITRTTYFSDHTDITQQVFDNSNQILSQHCWTYDKSGKNTGYRIDDYDENIYLIMDNSSATTSAVYDRYSDEIKYTYQYTRDAEGNITKALAKRQDGTIIQSKSYGYNFVQMDALFKVMIPFDTQKGISQYAGLTTELSNVLANAIWHQDSGIYDVTAENHPIFLYFASLDEDTQKQVAKLIKDKNIRNEMQLQLALINAGIKLDIPKPIVDVNKGKSELRIEHEETAILVTQAYDNAIAILEGHLQNLKDNMLTNLGEIILEDLRFWGPKLTCVGLNILGIGPDKAIKEISKNLDNGKIKALITSIHTEIDELKTKRANCTKLMNLAGTVSGKYDETYSEILHGKKYNPADLQDYKEKSKKAQTLLDKLMQRSTLGVEYAKAKNSFDTNKAAEIIGRVFKEGSKEFNAIKNTPEYKEYKQLIDKEISVARKKVTGNVEKEVEDYISWSSGTGMVAETIAFIVLTWGAGAELAGASWVARGSTLAKAFGGYTAARQSLNLLDDVDNWVKGDKTVLGSFVGEHNANIVKDIFSDNSSFSSLQDLSYDDFRASRGGHITIDSLASATFGFVAGVTSPYVAKLAEYPSNGVANMLGVDAKAFASSQSVLAKATQNALPKGTTSAAKFMAESQAGIMKTALKEACGIGADASKFANIAALAKYGSIESTRLVSHLLMETVLFSGVDISQSIVGEIFSESNKEFQDACKNGTILEYVGKKLKEQGTNLASIRAISTVLAMTLLSRPGNPLVKEYNKFDTINKAEVSTTKNGSVVVSVKNGGKAIFTEFTMDIYDQKGNLTRTVEFPDNDMPPAQRAYTFLQNVAYTEFLYKQPNYTYSQQKNNYLEYNQQENIDLEHEIPLTIEQSSDKLNTLDSSAKITRENIVAMKRNGYNVAITQQNQIITFTELGKVVEIGTLGKSSLADVKVKLDNISIAENGNKSTIITDQKIQESIDQLHTKMEEQMQVVGEAEINTCIENVSAKYGIPKPEVIKVVSRLTQFGSFGQLQNLGDKLSDLNIGDFYSNSGISSNAALHYLSKKKEQFSLTGEKTAFILDDSSIKYLEQLNAEQLEDFKQQVVDGKIILINLDGTGLQVGNKTNTYTAFDGGKDIEQLTSAVFEQIKQGKNIEDILNGHFQQRVNDVLGKEFRDKIVNISTTSKDDVPSIAKQIKPNMPSESAIRATIDVYVNELGYTPTQVNQVKSLLIKYIDNMMKMSSSNSFIGVLQKKQALIEQQVKDFGKTMDDVIYIFPRHGKSYDLIIYMYAKANGIDPSKIVKYNGTTKDIPAGKVMVMMDDVVGSGQSMMNGDLGGFLYAAAAENNPDSYMIFSPITCASKGRDYVRSRISDAGRSGKDALIYDESMMASFKDYIDSLPFEEKQVLIDALGPLGFDGNGLCTGFQYMVPDNCTDFSGYILNHCLNNSSSNRTLPDAEVWEKIKTLQKQYDLKVENYSTSKSQISTSSDIPLDTSVHSDNYLKILLAEIQANDDIMSIDKELYELAKTSKKLEMTEECSKYKYKDFEITTCLSYYGDTVVKNLNILDELGVTCAPKVVATIHKGNKVYIVTKNQGTTNEKLKSYLIGGPQNVSLEAKQKAFEDMKAITEAGYIDDQNLIPGNWCYTEDGEILLPKWNKLRKLAPEESKEDIIQEYYDIIFKEDNNNIAVINEIGKIETAIKAEYQPTVNIASTTLDRSNPTFESTEKISDYLHSKMQALTGSVNPEDITEWAKEISQKHGVSEQQVIDIMARLTQFGNYSQLQFLGEKLSELGVGEFYEEVGLSTNLAMRYLSIKKGQFEVNGDKKAFILDDASIKYLEKLNNEDLETFKQKVKDGEIILINLDGTGLQIGGNIYSYTVVDGGKSLKAMAEAVVLQGKNGVSVDESINSTYYNKISTVLGPEISQKIHNVQIATTDGNNFR